jgi:hypothetical protein
MKRRWARFTEIYVHQSAALSDADQRYVDSLNFQMRLSLGGGFLSVCAWIGVTLGNLRWHVALVVSLVTLATSAVHYLTSVTPARRAAGARGRDDSLTEADG